MKSSRKCDATRKTKSNRVHTATTPPRPVARASIRPRIARVRFAKRRVTARRGSLRLQFGGESLAAEWPAGAHAFSLAGSGPRVKIQVVIRTLRFSFRDCALPSEFFPLCY